MASLKKLSEAEKDKARKAGGLTKPPKKPKKSASVTALANYVTRHNAWVDRMRKKGTEKAKKTSAKEALKKAIWG